MRVRKVLLRAAAIACAAGLLVACASAEPSRTERALESENTAAEVVTTEETPSEEPTTVAQPSPAATPSPVLEVKEVTVTQKIAFKRSTVKDSSLAEGTRKVRTKGVTGVKTLTYEVTYTDGKETGRKLLREAVTKQPVTEVTVVGTKKPTRQCDPNYSGCVPIASDVDCAGGGGNGPAYVSGPVRVIGDDIYDLDRDGDGIACE
ncbi:G5 domain-containing protein [Phytohabitans kaempferiae]|uniref:G5 domain-containing protein n=1 Tax=Phytohabitans kaempferiae TaxID=1620943 RepID=A0ABV6M165_9ACTN